MAHLKGSLEINPWRDIPLLRQILYSTVISHTQLFLFMSLGHYESRRDAFNWRVRRLVKHGLVNRHTFSSLSADYLYTVTSSGVICLERHGDFYLPASPFVQNENKVEGLHLLHYLELNEIQLALLRSQLLCNWIPESRLRGLVSQGISPYAKAYDAIVEVKIGKRQTRFALEYERTQKNMKDYLDILEAIQAERNISLILYLVPSSGLMAKLAQYLGGSEHRLYFGLVDEFKQELLDTRISKYDRIRSVTLRHILEQS